MNLIDAIKSGKRFRRKGKDEWHSFNTTLLTPSEIRADDWEIEEEPKKKVVLYEVIYKTGLYWYISNTLRQEKDIPENYLKTGRTFEVEE